MSSMIFNRPAVEQTVFSVVQEALGNIKKHARAKRGAGTAIVFIKLYRYTGYIYEGFRKQFT